MKVYSVSMCISVEASGEQAAKNKVEKLLDNLAKHWNINNALCQSMEANEEIDD